MSAGSESVGLDQSENHVDQDTSAEVTSSEFVNGTHQPIITRKIDASRKHPEHSPEEHPKEHAIGRFPIHPQPFHVQELQEIRRQCPVEVNSSSDSRMKPPLNRRRTVSEGSTPHEENKIKQQASDDGSSSLVKHLQDKVCQLTNDNTSLQQRCEALEKNNKKFEKEVVDLRQRIYEQNKLAVLHKHVDKEVQTNQGMDICLTTLFKVAGK